MTSLVALMGQQPDYVGNFQRAQNNASINKLAKLKVDAAPEEMARSSRLADLQFQAQQTDNQAKLQTLNQSKEDAQRKRLVEGARGVLSAPEPLRKQAYKQYVDDLSRIHGVPVEEGDYEMDDDDLAQLNYFAAQGRTADAMFKPEQKSEFEQKLRLAGIDPSTPEGQQAARGVLMKPTTQINLDQKGLAEEQKQLAKVRASRFDQIVQTADEAVSMNERLGQMENIDVSMGFGEESKAGLAGIFNAMGVNGDKLLGVNVANTQAFRAVSGQLLAESLAAQKGPQTDRDAARIQDTLPKIGNEAVANKFIITSLKAVNQRKIEQAKFYEDYLEENGTMKGVDSEWASFKSQTPLLSNNVKNPENGLPMFFYEFREKAQAANPGATDEQITEAWRKMAKGN